MNQTDKITLSIIYRKSGLRNVMVTLPSGKRYEIVIANEIDLEKFITIKHDRISFLDMKRIQSSEVTQHIPHIELTLLQILLTHLHKEIPYLFRWEAGELDTRSVEFTVLNEPTQCIIKLQDTIVLVAYD